MRLFLCLLILPLTSGCNGLFEESPFYSRETTHKSYQDVMAELEIAITERNFRITGHNRIGSVIRERDGIEFPEYDSFQFCNLTEARVMLEISPAAVSWMPCNISLRSEGDRVIVTTHLLPLHNSNRKLDEFSTQINQRLKDIVDFAVAD